MSPLDGRADSGSQRVQRARAAKDHDAALQPDLKRRMCGAAARLRCAVGAEQGQREAREQVRPKCVERQECPRLEELKLLDACKACTSKPWTLTSAIPASCALEPAPHTAAEPAPPCCAVQPQVLRLTLMASIDLGIGA
jgi:hypothetical protein